MHRTFLVLGSMAAVVLIAPAALAGGWAVTSFDQLPPEFQAGETYPLGYTVLQHGQTPVQVDTEIVARSEDGRQVSFTGVPEGPVGHYLAEVRFPQSGRWSWQVTQGPFGPQELGYVTVLPAASPTAPALDPSLAWLRVLLPVLTVVAVAAFGLQLTAYRQARGRPAGG